MLSATFLVVIIASSSLGYTLHGDRLDIFPSQLPNDDENSFLRIDSNNNVQVLTCPRGFRFDFQLVKCSEILDADASRAVHNLCPESQRGPIPYWKDCRRFVNCWDGMGHLMQCDAHLLFNELLEQCDQPETSNCCEYWEKNPNRYVQ